MRSLWTGVFAVLAACGGSSSGDDDGGPPVTQEEITAACVVAGSCATGDGINDCFTDIIPLLKPDEIRCLIDARSDCIAARACLGFQAENAPTCTPGRVCDGNKLVDCGDGVRATYECGSTFTTGPACVIGSNGQAKCGVATCSAPSRACDGSRAQTCDVTRGVLESIDCAARGLQCVNGACTSPGGGGACNSGAPLRCEGTAIVDCDDGVETRFDCAALSSGATCFAVTAPFPDAYCGFASTCYPEKGAETCSGTSINFCAAGVPATVDCASLGFSMCLGSKCFP